MLILKFEQPSVFIIFSFTSLKFGNFFLLNSNIAVDSRLIGWTDTNSVAKIAKILPSSGS